MYVLVRFEKSKRKKGGRAVIKLKGMSINNGTAKGKLLFLPHEEIIVRKQIVENPEKELENYHKAQKLALAELRELYVKASEKLDKDIAEIFVIHRMFIEDEDFEESIRNIIVNEHFNADFAVVITTRTFAKAFCHVDSEYIKGRSADLKDISKRLIWHIQNKEIQTVKLAEKAIICAEEIMPSGLVNLDIAKILAICTRKGSILSHSAIIAKALNIPMIAGLGKRLSDNLDGHCATVNGSEGTVAVEI